MKNSPEQVLLFEILKPSCGDEIVMIKQENQDFSNPQLAVGDGSLTGSRHRHILNETTGELTVYPFEGTDPSPLVSNSLFCPVIGYQIYKGDGQGGIIGASQPNVARLTHESNNVTTGITINNALAYN